MKKIWILFFLMIVVILLLQMGVFGEEKKEILSEFGDVGGFKNNEDLQRTPGGAYNFINGKDTTEGVILTVPKNAKLQYKHGNEKEYRKFSNLEEDSQFKFNKGELIEANFQVTNKKYDQECDGAYGGCYINTAQYKLGNNVYNIPLSSKVIFKKGEEGKPDIVKIEQKHGTIAYPPKVIDKNKLDNKKTEVSYYLPEDAKLGSSLSIEKDNEKYKIFKRKEFDFGPNYGLKFDTEKNRFFTKGAQHIDNLEIGSIQSADTYLFLGENIPDNFDKPAIMLGKGENPDLKLFSPAGNKGFSVKILQHVDGVDKKYGGLEVKEGENLVFWARGAGEDFQTKKDINSKSEININNINGKPLVTTKGAFEIFNGKNWIGYNEHTEGTLRTRTSREKSSISSDGKKVEYDFSKLNAVPIQIHIDDIKSAYGESDVFILTDKDNKQGYIGTGKSEIDTNNNVKIAGIDPKLKSTFDNSPQNKQQELLGGNPKDINKQLEKIKSENDNKANTKKTTTTNVIKSNVPQELRNLQIDKNIVKKLDEEIKGDGGRLGAISKLPTYKANDEGIIAVVIGKDKCPGCETLENNVKVGGSKINGLVYKINYVGNGIKTVKKFGVNWDVDVDVKVQESFKTNIGLDKNELYQIMDRRGLGFPTTTFIDTKSGKIIGLESGSNVDFNKYFK